MTPAAPINRREFSRNLFTGLGAAVLSPVIGSQRAAATEIPARPVKPNLVFVLSDQHAYRYCGFMNHPIVRTPNLDRIAGRGVVFNHAYCGSPVCTPSRAGILSGVYPSDVNSFCNSTVWDGSLPAWPALLRDAGYTTFGTGKMDTNDRFDMGFTRVGELGNQHQNDPDVTSLFRRPLCGRINERPVINGRARKEGGSSGDARNTDSTVEFIRGQQGATGPWAVYLGINKPHPPFAAQQEHFDYYLRRVDLPNVPPGHLEELHYIYQQMRNFKNMATPIPEDRQRRARAAYFGMITEVDDHVGRIWQALEATGQLEHTIFIYSSDHGESLGEHGLWLKNNLYDGSARVPLVIAGAGIPQGVKVDTPVAHVDLIRTMIEWGAAQTHSRLRGHSLEPLMHGAKGDHPGWAYTESHSEGNCTGSFMIRRGEWKYIHISRHPPMLFNLADDPDEFVNLAETPQGKPVAAELAGILRSQVDPEALTERAFAAQKKRLAELAHGLTPDEMLDLFRGRFGEGESVELLTAYYGHTFPYTHKAPKDAATG